jgi:hypothetical protein
MLAGTKPVGTAVVVVVGAPVVAERSVPVCAVVAVFASTSGSGLSLVGVVVVVLAGSLGAQEAARITERASRNIQRGIIES